MSKTLDQASAQFAASALVTTDQLLAFKSKEDLVVTSGLNGVLTGAGQWVIRPLIASRSVVIRSSFKCHISKQLLMFN